MSDKLQGITQGDLEWAFNTWMDEYIADPSGFSANFQVVDAHREDRSYGDSCVAYIKHLLQK